MPKAMPLAKPTMQARTLIRPIMIQAPRDIEEGIKGLGRQVEVVEGGGAGGGFEESGDFREEEVGFVQDVIEVGGEDVVDLGQGACFGKPEAVDEADLAIWKDFAADPWVALEFR